MTAAIQQAAPRVHIYVAGAQPATRFSVDGCVLRYHERHLFRCGRCQRKRWAKNLTVQAYYDALYFRCREPAECRKPRAVVAKERK